MQSALARFEGILDRLDARINAGGRKWPVGLFLLAFILKAIYVVVTTNAVEIRVPIMDVLYYDEMAQDIAAGKFMRPGAFFMGPLYPYFLSIVYSTYGRDFLVVRMIQALGGAGTVVVTFYLGKWLFRPSVGLLAALMLCFYGAITFYETQMLMMWMGALLNISALAVLVAARGHRGIWRYAMAGLLIGLSALARANVLVFVPVAAAWIVWIVAGNGRWRRAGALVAGVIVTLLPATIHNYVASRDFVLVTSNAGLNFYIGNSALATGIFYWPPGVDFVGDSTTRIHIERKLGRDLQPSEVSRYWFGEALRDIDDDPEREIRLLLRKAAMFFNGYEVPQIESFEISKYRHGILRVLFVNFWFLAALGIVGIVFTLRRWRDYSLLSGFVIVYALSIIAFFVTARYRVQIAPMLALFSSCALLMVIPKWLTTVRRAVAFVGIFGVTLLLTNPVLFAWDENEMMFREDVHRARRMSRDGSYRTAIAEIDRAIERFPDHVEGYIHRAIIHKEGGDRFAAIEDYARAIKIRPDVASVHYDLAQTLRLLKMSEEAIKEYRAALEIDPVMVKAQNNLGITLREVRRYEEAADAFRRVLELDPSYVKGYNNLGAALAEGGKAEEALEVFSLATERFPDYANSYRNLAMANITLRRVRPAIAAMEKYVELNPDDTAAQDMLRKLYVAERADTTSAPLRNN